MPVQLGAAIKQVRGSVGQVELAERMKVAQGTISKWESDNPRPSLEQIVAIETALGVQRGSILVAAGLVEVGSVEAAILADDDLNDDQRSFMLNAYQGAKALSTIDLRRRPRRRTPGQ